MSMIKIKLEDGEGFLPELFKIISHPYENFLDPKPLAATAYLFRILPEKYGEYNYIQYITTYNFCVMRITSDFFPKDYYKNIIEISKEEWNDTIKKISNDKVEKNLIK